jgi:NADH:ubiquinone oxidoreductase subunit 5 (subunit L)/multisubunit Na+/H+ antiporter MnhA subunit
MFHLVTHASFKALLFLTAGVVIHALHGREKLSDMGGLRKDLPGAYAAFLVGSLALIGVPFFSGAFSKDMIIEAAQAHDPLPPLLWLGLFAGVFVTGWYTGRLFFGVFHGEKKYHGPLHYPSGSMLWPLVPLAIGAVFLGYLEWPAPLLSNMLHGTVGEAEAIQFPTLWSLVPGAVGLAGFLIPNLWKSSEPVAATAAAGHDDGHGDHYVEPLEPNIGWSDWVAERSYALAGAVAGLQNGHLSRYILISVLGVAAILLLTLAGVSQTMTGLR